MGECSRKRSSLHDFFFFFVVEGKGEGDGNEG